MLGCLVQVIKPDTSNLSKIGKALELSDVWWLVSFDDGSKREYRPKHFLVIQEAGDAEAASASATGSTALCPGLLQEPDFQDANMAPKGSAPVSALLQSCADAFRTFKTCNRN